MSWDWVKTSGANNEVDRPKGCNPYVYLTRLSDEELIFIKNVDKCKKQLQIATGAQGPVGLTGPVGPIGASTPTGPIKPRATGFDISFVKIGERILAEKKQEASVEKLRNEHKANMEKAASHAFMYGSSLDGFFA